VDGEALGRVTTAWPRPLAFADVGDPSAQPRETLGSNFLAAFAANQLQLGLSDRGIPEAISASPRALASARAQAQRGSRFATNLWHQSVVLEPWQKLLLPLLDGTRSREALSTSLSERGLAVSPEALEGQLAALARLALLVA
jgi:hypothetical protein